MYKPSVVFHFVDYLFCFRPPNRLFFRLKTSSVVSSIHHSELKETVVFSAKLVHLPMAQDNATKASNKEQIL